MSEHQAPFASDWHRLTAFYSVRFTIDAPIDGVAQVQAIWSTDQPPPPRAMQALSANFYTALNAFIATIGFVELPA